MCTYLKTARRYLLWCVNEHVEFRFAELQSLASMLNIYVNWIDKPTEAPYIVVETATENDIKKLMSRSMLISSCYELWGCGNSLEELHLNVKNFPLERIKPFIANGKSFKVCVEAFNKTLRSAQKLEKIESFSYLPFQGRVNLKNPDTQLQLIEYYGLHPNSIPDHPYKVFFGRWIADGQRHLIKSFSLKHRIYIGSTSMDPQLAFIMTNIAQVKPGDIIVDPFVGTGSILVSAAFQGAYVWGWDIDYLTLHARTKPTRYMQKERGAKESIRNNLNQYNLGHHYLDVIVMDSAKPFWRCSNHINAIITDPPYGIREATERVGTTKLNVSDIQSSIPPKSAHFPSKVSYSLSEIICDLLNFAALHLVLNGRLIFWLPVLRDEYSEDCIPQHPCLDVKSNCEQILNAHSSRRLLCYVKTRDPLECETASSTHINSGSFRSKFFQASFLNKVERLSKKSHFASDKRGQGLGYRLSNSSDVANTT